MRALLRGITLSIATAKTCIAYVQLSLLPKSLALVLELEPLCLLCCNAFSQDVFCVEAISLEAIALRLEAMAIRLEAIAGGHRY